MKNALTIAAAVFGAMAAGLWFYASVVKVRHDPNEVDEHGWKPAAIIKDDGPSRRVDVLKTAEAQTRWNARAAGAASIAAACQVALLWY